MVFVPQMHFEVADSSSIRGGGRRARPRALVWLGIRPWREGERQWREEESPWRESRESECSVPSVPLGRSGFSRSLRFVCKQFPFLWNGREASFVPNGISRFLSSRIASSKIPVTFLRSKRGALSPSRWCCDATQIEAACIDSGIQRRRRAVWLLFYDVAGLDAAPPSRALD